MQQNQSEPQLLSRKSRASKLKLPKIQTNPRNLFLHDQKVRKESKQFELNLQQQQQLQQLQYMQQQQQYQQNLQSRQKSPKTPNQNTAKSPMKKNNYKIEPETKKQKHYRKLLANQKYAQMLELPIIIKEKELYNRKNTIGVFKTHKIQNVQSTQKINLKEALQKKADSEMGKMYINELWSDKFQKLILKESRIQKNLDKISRLYRRDMQEAMKEIQIISQEKNAQSHNLTSSMIQQFIHFSNNDYDFHKKNFKQLQKYSSKTEAYNSPQDLSLIRENTDRIHSNNASFANNLKLEFSILKSLQQQKQSNINDSTLPYDQILNSRDESIINSKRYATQNNTMITDQFQDQEDDEYNQEEENDDDDDENMEGELGDTEKKNKLYLPLEKLKKMNKGEVKSWQSKCKGIISQTQDVLSHRLHKDYNDIRKIRQKQMSQRKFEASNSQVGTERKQYTEQQQQYDDELQNNQYPELRTHH